MERRRSRRRKKRVQVQQKKAGNENSSELTSANVSICISAAGEAADAERDVGWGRVCLFLQKLGQKADSRSLSLAHCDLTATDLLELGAQPSLLQFFLSSLFCLLTQATSSRGYPH